MEIPGFELNHTAQFTWVSSVAPNAAPTLLVENGSGTTVASITAQQSDSTHYYALYTMPASEQYMVGRWVALKTVSGSAYSFRKSFPFKVTQVTVP